MTVNSLISINKLLKILRFVHLIRFFVEGSGRGQISSTIPKFPKGTETNYEEPELGWSVGPHKFQTIAFRIAYHFNQLAWLQNITLLMRSVGFCQRCC